MIALAASSNINAATQAKNSCVPDNWDGYWSTISQCYFDKVDRQIETLSYLQRENDLSALQKSVKKVCSKKIEDFGGEMAKHIYWDCFTESLQSEIDLGTATAAKNLLAFKHVDWDAINHCKATYFYAAVETKAGSILKDSKGWSPSDFPKEVMDANCQVVASDVGLIVYEGTKDWEPGNHFFYVRVFDNSLISIHSQPELTSTHAQWAVTEHAYITNDSNTSGCFKSAEIEICYSTSPN